MDPETVSTSLVTADDRDCFRQVKPLFGQLDFFLEAFDISSRYVP
jgi:hypothetical protein